MLLAKSGVKVTIVEKRDQVGGRTSTWEQDGYKFDVGPTFFLYPRVLKEIFGAAGYDLDREVPMTRLDPQYRLVFGEAANFWQLRMSSRWRKRSRPYRPRTPSAFMYF